MLNQQAGNLSMASSGDSLAEVNLTEVVASILCEFLEVTFHLILYIREVYPAASFQRRHKYNVPIQMCAHPELNQYVRNMLGSIRPLLEKGAVEKVVLAIEDKEHRPVERFVFHFQGLNEQALRDDGYLLLLENDLRALLLKINVCDALLQPNPPDCTFTILVHTSQVAVASMEHEQQAKEFPWVTSDQQQVDDIPDANTIPLKSISSSILKLQLIVNESPDKTERR